MTLRKYRKQKINTYVSAEDHQRLQRICKDYDFASIYELMKYLVNCFLRVADPKNDTSEDVLHQPIIEMFSNPHEYNRLRKPAKRGAKKPAKRKIAFQFTIPFTDLKKVETNEMNLGDDVSEMFEECEDLSGIDDLAYLDQGLNVEQKKDYRKIQTPDDLKP